MHLTLQQTAGLPLVSRRWVRKSWETFERVLWLDDSREPSPDSLIWVEPDRRIVCLDWPLQNAISTATTLFKVPPISDVVGHVAWVTVVPWSLQPEFYRASRFFLGLTETHVPLMTKLCQPTRPQAARVFARFFQYPWRMASSVPYLVENALKFMPGVGYLIRYGILRSTPTDGTSDGNTQIRLDPDFVGLSLSCRSLCRLRALFGHLGCISPSLVSTCSSLACLLH